MDIFHRQHHNQAGSVAHTRQYLEECHGPCGSAGLRYSASPSSNQTSTSMIPPPPYNEYDIRQLPPEQGYRPTMASRQSHPIHSASTSMLDVSRLWAHNPHGARHGEQSTTALVHHRLTPQDYLECPIARGMNQGAALCDRIGLALNDMLSRCDCAETNENEILQLARRLDVHEAEDLDLPVRSRRPQQRANAGETSVQLKKSWMYSNSRLPPGMLPFKAYLSTWTLVCRGAQASVEVYDRPRSDQREYYTNADPKLGTKAMIVKSQPVDDRNLIIVAVRGSQWNFVDWAVNIREAPMQPTGFLDDEGNECHAGFLHVARSMIAPVAARLRDLIQNDASCCGSSLLFTGHSAGGAVASLLYSHMVSTQNSSALTDLAGIFKRVHCVIFGAPPVSLLPLQKPSGRANNKDVFLSFANEGDPVVRLDGPRYFLSMTKLYAAPAPANNVQNKLHEKASRQHLGSKERLNSPSYTPTRWPVPPTTLSVAGRMVLLRETPRDKHRAIEAVQVTDEELRDRVFADLSMHSMVMYKQRVDGLAFAAVSGHDAG